MPGAPIYKKECKRCKQTVIDEDGIEVVVTAVKKVKICPEPFLPPCSNCDGGEKKAEDLKPFYGYKEKCTKCKDGDENAEEVNDDADPEEIKDEADPEEIKDEEPQEDVADDVAGDDDEDI